MKATERPWGEGCSLGKTIQDELFYYDIYHQAGPIRRRVATGYGIDQSEAQSNAELIVRAVNNHDELLKALKEMCKYWDWSIGDPDFEAYRRAKQAIKKAKS